MEFYGFKKSDDFENLLYKSFRRYYIEDLAKRDFTLENTTPHMIIIFDEIIEEHSWGNMLVKVVDLLIEKKPKATKDLESFRTGWSKKEIFSSTKKTNCKPLQNGMFLNCNHTAQHSCWLLQDLLGFFDVDIDTVSFIIYRPHSAEPKQVKEYVGNKTKEKFCDYLSNVCEKSDSEIAQVIKDIDEILNKILSTKLCKTPSYIDFFLFDNNACFYNYSKKAKDYLEKKLNLKDRSRFVEILDILSGFYKNYLLK